MKYTHISQKMVSMICSLVADASHDARWRRERLSHHEFLAKQLQRGALISPIFDAPFVTTKTFRRDWLHLVDLGIAADYLGNLFKVFRDKLPGRNQEVRVRALWLRVLAFYNGPPVITDRLAKLPNSWIQADGQKPPKLKGNASTTRALVPFAYTLAQELLDPADPKEEAMIVGADHLNRCYTCLSSNTYGWREILARSSSAFVLQFGALQAASDGIHWRCKPKLHHLSGVMCLRWQTIAVLDISRRGLWWECCSVLALSWWCADTKTCVVQYTVEVQVLESSAKTD